MSANVHVRNENWEFETPFPELAGRRSLVSWFAYVFTLGHHLRMVQWVRDFIHGNRALRRWFCIVLTDIACSRRSSGPISTICRLFILEIARSYRICLGNLT
jgi:hypothetical protein